MFIHSYYRHIFVVYIIVLMLSLNYQNRDERHSDAHRMDQHSSSSGHMGPPGSRSSTVLPDLLSQVMLFYSN